MDPTLESLKDLAVRHGDVVIRTNPCKKVTWEVEVGASTVYGYGRNLKQAVEMALEDESGE